MDTMKTMNVIMPIFSGIITLTLPIGVGIYWITSSLISIIIQIIINAKLKNIDVQVFVDESAEKNNSPFAGHSDIGGLRRRACLTRIIC